jgi:hypothetical protein
MKKSLAEKNIAVLLFVVVLVVFTLAQRDTKKIVRLYTLVNKKSEKLAFLKSSKVARAPYKAVITD